MSKSLYQTNVESRAPLTTDVGVVGNWWVDTSASPADLYLCTGATGGVYTWTKQGGGSGGINSTTYTTLSDFEDALTNLEDTHYILGFEYEISSYQSSSSQGVKIDTTNSTITNFTNAGGGINAKNKFYKTGRLTYETKQANFEQNIIKVTAPYSAGNQFNQVVLWRESDQDGTGVYNVYIPKDIKTIFRNNFVSATLYYI